MIECENSLVNVDKSGKNLRNSFLFELTKGDPFWKSAMTSSNFRVTYGILFLESSSPSFFFENYS